MTQNNLGSALQTLGKRESDTGRLEQAVAAYRAALGGTYTRDGVPLGWAGTQNNLGNALRALGEQDRDTERLEQAVAAYRAALEEYTRDRVPFQWAATQNNLGSAPSEALVNGRMTRRNLSRRSRPTSWPSGNSLAIACRSNGRNAEQSRQCPSEAW